MATIRKRGNKWQVQIRRQGIKATSRSFLQKSDAERWARKLEIEADRGGIIDQRELRRICFSDLIDRYLVNEVQEHRSTTTAVVLGVIRRHLMAKLRAAELSSAVFAAYRNERLKEVQPSTVLRELGVLHRLFQIARFDWGLPITPNPVDGCSRGLSGRERQRRINNPGEIAALNAAFSDCRNPLLRPFAELTVATGMRRSELLKARWADISSETQTLHIPDTKNGHPRTIPLSREALSIISRLPRNHELLFPLSANAAKLGWQRVVRRAGLKDLHFHDLRHEAISRFFEKGLSIPEVALISGHRDLRMLFRYTHLKPEDVARKLE